MGDWIDWLMSCLYLSDACFDWVKLLWVLGSNCVGTLDPILVEARRTVMLAHDARFRRASDLTIWIKIGIGIEIDSGFCDTV